MLPIIAFDGFSPGSDKTNPPKLQSDGSVKLRKSDCKLIKSKTHKSCIYELAINNSAREQPSPSYKGRIKVPQQFQFCTKSDVVGRKVPTSHEDTDQKVPMTTKTR